VGVICFNFFGPPPGTLRAPTSPFQGEVSAPAQLHQSRQKAGECLAGAGGRDQERGTIIAGFFEQRQLMCARRPTARGEPAQKISWQKRGRKKVWFGGIHKLQVKPIQPDRSRT